MNDEEKILKILETIQADVAALKKGQAVFESRIDKLELRLENEAFDKIRALFDAREVQKDVNDRILSALTRIEGKLDWLSHKVVSHDAVLKR